MSATPLPPHLVALLDQRSAQCGEALDGAVAMARLLLVCGVDPTAAAEMIAHRLVETDTSLNQLAVAYSYSLVRLAQQGGGQS